MPSMREGFKGVSLKTSLYNEVENYVEDSIGYKSVAEFVSEAIRLRLEQLKSQKASAI